MRGLRLGRRVPPYVRLARRYDDTLGIENHRRTRAAFRRLVRIYGIRFRTAADLGCGTGMFARHLARRWGARVFAVDRSIAMLQRACENASGEPVMLVHQDLRDLCLPERVDLATANFDTVNHLTTERDVRRVFARVAASLKPGGFFLFDVITPCSPLGGLRYFARSMRCSSGRVLQRIAWDALRRLIRIQIVVQEPPFAMGVEEHQERAWDPAALGRWLLDSGFLIRGVHDAASLRPAGACPPRIVVVAQKQP